MVELAVLVVAFALLLALVVYWVVKFIVSLWTGA